MVIESFYALKKKFMRFFRYLMSKLILKMTFGGPKSKSAFLNIILTDIREEPAKQKSLSFDTVIKKFLSEGYSVSIIVPGGNKDRYETLIRYQRIFQKHTTSSKFNIIYISPRWVLIERVACIFYVIFFFIFIKCSYRRRFNISCLMALSIVKLNFYKRVFDVVTCNHWLGLTGGIELPTLKVRALEVGASTCVNALQFGQASDEQRHFEGYNVDRFFVYDKLSRSIYEKLSMRVGEIVTCGSPEFEYYLNESKSSDLISHQKLNIAFVDQPVFQRSEYHISFVKNLETMLDELNSDNLLNFYVKPHPRGTAFTKEFMSKCKVKLCWQECLSDSHVVIGFFSNLCDMALLSNRPTFYLGAEWVLDRNKQDWITSKGGIVSSDMSLVKFELQKIIKSPAELANNILMKKKYWGAAASEKIFTTMVACSEAETIS